MVSDEASEVAFTESRSRLYRGITRAHMLALVVNEFVADGWLAYLTTVKLKEDERFDAEEMARMSREQQARLDAENKRQQESQATAEAFIEGRSLKTELSGDEFAFVHKKILAAVDRQVEDLEGVLATAKTVEWPRQQQLDRIPHLVAELTSVDDADARTYVGQLSTEAAKASQGTSVVTADEAIELSLADWREAGAALASLIDERQLRVTNAKRPSLQFHTASTCRKTKGQRDVQKAASGALAKWQLEESVGAAFAQLKAQAAAMALSPTALRALQPIVRRSVRSGKPADGAVAEALELWQATNTALQTLADEKHVTDRQSWVQVVDIVHSCVGQAGETLLAQVGRNVAAWEETKKQELEQQRAEQSIWETSGNATSQIAAARAPARERQHAAQQEPAAMHEPEPEPQSRVDTLTLAQVSRMAASPNFSGKASHPGGRCESHCISAPRSSEFIRTGVSAQSLSRPELMAWRCRKPPFRGR